MPYKDPIKRKEFTKQWKKINPDKVKEHQRKWVLNCDKDKLMNYKRKWRKDNREMTNLTTLNYHNNRRKRDPLFKLKDNIRCLIRTSIKKKGHSKTSKTQIILGTDYKSFKEYLEGLWEPWMSWDNYGLYKKDTFNYGWDIDHIIPSSSAKTEEELIKLNYYTNLKPLCSKVNRDIKKDKLL
jgi:hypothetical protein